jgi:hypothetical protein
MPARMPFAAGARTLRPIYDRPIDYVNRELEYEQQTMNRMCKKLRHQRTILEPIAECEKRFSIKNNVCWKNSAQT